MTTFTQTLAAFALAAAAAGAHANLVTNGSFEQGAIGGSFAGWTTTLGDPATFVDYGPTGTQAGDSSDGLWSAYFGSTAAAGGETIAQSLATTAGQAYVLSFDLANDNAGGDPANAFAVSVGGVTLFSASALADQGYVHETLSFTATGASTTLSFFASNDIGYAQLDDVVVDAAPLPEPGVAALLLAGLAAIGVTRRRGAR